MPSLSTEILTQVLDAIPKTWDVGTITAVGTNSASVQVADITLTRIHWILGFTPSVGDVVVLLGGGDQRLILGAISPPDPPDQGDDDPTIPTD